MTGSIQSHVAAVPQRNVGRGWARVVALVVALLFIQHGAVHFMGFALTFGLATTDAVCDGYTLVAGLDPDGPAMRALGIAWLLPSPLYLIASAGLVLLRTWWQVWALAATVVSLVLCVLWIQPAIVGVVVDVVILAGLAAYAVAARRRRSGEGAA